jgi:hypothetical protein
MMQVFGFVLLCACRAVVQLVEEKIYTKNDVSEGLCDRTAGENRRKRNETNLQPLGNGGAVHDGGRRTQQQIAPAVAGSLVHQAVVALL